MKPYEGYINPSSNPAAELKKSLETLKNQGKRILIFT